VGINTKRWGRGRDKYQEVGRDRDKYQEVSGAGVGINSKRWGRVGINNI